MPVVRQVIVFSIPAKDLAYRVFSVVAELEKTVKMESDRVGFSVVAQVEMAQVCRSVLGTQTIDLERQSRNELAWVPGRGDHPASGLRGRAVRGD